MTATTSKKHTLHCDDKSWVCPRVFMGQPNESKSDVRKRATTHFGWTFVPHGSGLNQDFCPEHPPEAVTEPVDGSLRPGEPQPLLRTRRPSPRPGRLP